MSMSTSTVDIRMAHLIDLGFTPTQSAEFASRYRTVEAAIEAILRETPTQQQQQQITSPSPRITRDESYEEHKEMVPHELAPTEWIPLRRVTFTTKAIDTLEDEECDQDKYSSFSSDDVDYFEHAVDGLFLSDSSTGGCEFEVLHSSIGLPSDTPLREWNRKKIIDAFEASTNKWMGKARQEGIATDESATSLALTSNLQDELTFLSVASITDDGETTTSINPLSVNTSGITSACSSTCTTPRIHEEENTEEGFEKEESALATCCFCMDEIPDTLLLPCCHLPLCSSCTLDYFSRLRSHNHSVHQLQQEEVDLIRNHSAVTRRKTQMRTFACPTCATEIHFAVKRRTNESKV